MKKEVLIRVKGVQDNGQGEKEAIEMITAGYLYTFSEKFYLLYNETEISGMEGTTTSLKIEPGKVTLNRMGTSAQKQIFKEGVVDSGFYKTPYGSMYISVMPSKVEVTLTEHGGSINLEYELKVEEKMLSFNELSISIAEVSAEHGPSCISSERNKKGIKRGNFPGEARKRT